MTTVYLVRHGQASFGGANYDRLSDLGRRQSRLLGEHLQRVGATFDAFFCGRMERQRDTALELIGGLGAGATPQVEPGFDEYDFLGVLRAYLPVVAQQHPEISLDMRKLFTAPRAFQDAFEKCIALWVRAHAYSGTPIETWSAFCERARAAIRAAAPEGHERVLIATSGGIVAAALQEALALDHDMAFALNWRINNGSIHRFRLGRRGLSLLGFNDVSHLELAGGGELLTYR